MAADHTSTFGSSLEGLGVGWTRVEAAGFSEALADVVEEPAVGVPLPFDGVSLADTSVEVDPTPAALEAATTGVTPVGLGIADYGSILVEHSLAGEEPVSLFVDVHVAVLAESDVVPDMPAAFGRMGESFRAGRDDAIIATGASATADMGALVEGVHGPEEVHVIVLEDR